MELKPVSGGFIFLQLSLPNAIQHSCPNLHANYVVHSDASNGVGDVARSGVPPPQHSRACDFLNDRSV